MDEFVRRPKRPKLDLATAFPNRSLHPTRAAIDTTSQEIPAPPPADILPADDSEPNVKSKKDKPRIRIPKIPMPKNKKQWAITIAAAVLLLGSSGFALYWFIIKKEAPVVIQPEPEPEPEPEPIPTTETSKVSGRQIPIGDNAKPIYAIQIENSPEARPQSGLKEADIISEAVAEGGITRFNAIFHDFVPANIGPIRSLRPYYIDWFLPYNAPIVHAGGSPEALSDIRSLGVQDMEHGVNGAYFRRVSNRYAPHNLYSTGSQMLDLYTKKGYSNGDFTGLIRKEIPKETDETEEATETTPTPAPAPTAKTINLKISSTLYNVSYSYDAATNKYLRAQGGGPHIDAESGQQLQTDVVIVPVMSKKIHPDRVHTQYGSVGSGKVFVFQDGGVIEGTWKKEARNTQWQLLDAAGAPIALNPGQTWFTMIDAAASVTYQP
jgi:hypothetical protein